MEGVKERRERECVERGRGVVEHRAAAQAAESRQLRESVCVSRERENVVRESSLRKRSEGRRGRQRSQIVYPRVGV